MTYALIALEHASGNVSRMQFGTYRKRHQLDDALALKSGFKLDEDGHWTREASDDFVTAEIKKSAFADAVTRWWRPKDESELPPRQQRVKAKVVALQPVATPDEDPLPQFLQRAQPQPVAPEMSARLDAFEQRVKEVIDRPVPRFSEDDIAALRQEFNQKLEEMKRGFELFVAREFRKVGGGT
jgi:hypothetical protein